jgi:hypothetical protein
VTVSPGAEAPRPGPAAYARPFAAAAGVALAGLGLLGILGNPLVGAVANLPVVVTGPVHDVLHVVLGALYLHVAFALAGRLQGDGLVALGAFGLLFGVLSLASPDLFGLLDEGTNLADQLLHLVVGAVSVGLGWVVRSGRPLSLPRRGGAGTEP